MLTTKNEIKSYWFVVFLALAAALAGCSPPGTHALLKGKKLFDQGEYADAADEFKAATEAMATNAEAWNYLGVAEQHAGQFEEAANAYKRALELDRDLTEAHYNLGCLWMEQNKMDDAISEFTAYTLRRVNEPEGWLELGLAQLRAHDVLPAEKSFSTALYLSPNNAEALNGLGLARMQRGRPEEAEKFFQAAVQYHPDFGPAILNLATVERDYLHNDRYALDEYRSYLALEPRPANWDEVNAIVTSLEQSQTQSVPMATAASGQQTGQNPEEWQNQTAMEPPRTESSETRRERPAKSQAKRTHNAVSAAPAETVPMQRQPTVASAQNPAPAPPSERDLFSSGVVNSQPVNSGAQGNPNSVQWLRPSPVQESKVKVTPLPPENESEGGTPAPVRIVQPAPPVYPRYLYLSPARPAAGSRHAATVMFNRARDAEREGRFPDSLDEYRQATRLDPSWFEAQYNCGVMAYRLRDYQFSLAAYEMALAIEPDSSDARYNFALALRAAGYIPDAVNELRRILASNPGNARVHLELGNLYAQKLLDVPHAREQYLKVLQLDPGNPQASSIMSWLSANPE